MDLQRDEEWWWRIVIVFAEQIWYHQFNVRSTGKGVDFRRQTVKVNAKRMASWADRTTKRGRVRWKSSRGG